MLKNASIVMLASLGLLQGCAEAPLRTMSSGATSNCVVAPNTCLLQITHTTTIFGRDIFKIDVDPSYPPANPAAPVHVYWMLPPGFVFADTNQGPQLAITTPPDLFSDKFVVDANFNRVTGPGPGFHWGLMSGIANFSVKYNVVFRQLSPARQWTCDPTIANFGGQSMQLAAVSMSCKSP